MLLTKCSNSCAAFEIRCIQLCIAGANESGTKSVFVVLLRNAQTDLAIQIWTILVPIRLKKNKNKNGFGPFSYKSFSFL